MIDELKKGGEICKKIKKELPKRVVVGTSILELANWVESEIRKGGQEPAFPANISINDVAAHFSPGPNDKSVFETGQLIKVDFGAHQDGWVTDNSLCINLGDFDELTLAANEALVEATKTIKQYGSKATLSQIGKSIEDAIKNRGFEPITNLTGHKIDQWILHAGLSIYNYDSGSDRAIGDGIFAVEPFATTGVGRIKNGPNSEIFRLMKTTPQRLPNLRTLVNELTKFKTLPFSSRWVSKPEYLRVLLRDKTLHNYPLLVEESGGMVSQAEDTFLVEGENVTVLTS
ncbi:MAG: type II methionyl aminopeptidase [Candidatus Altiarchaeota archaeon]|nr:type II methionyl aminopeptidase [Candidatus Altiarchaeota archaeon]